MNIRKSIIPYIQDYSKKTIYYKTDEQPRLGTFATGKKINHSYKLNINNI